MWMLLRELGVVDALIHARLIGWDGERIVVPVFNRERRVVFFEYWELDSEDRPRPVPKRDGAVALYREEILDHTPRSVIITQGVLESLVLSSQAFNVVSATGDGLAFKEEWGGLFVGLHEIFVCFKQGDVERRAAERIAGLLSQALVVELPEEVGEGGGLVEFFGRCGKTRMDFLRLLATAGLDRWEEGSSSIGHGR